MQQAGRPRGQKLVERLMITPSLSCHVLMTKLSSKTIYYYNPLFKQFLTSKSARRVFNCTWVYATTTPGCREVVLISVVLCTHSKRKGEKKNKGVA